MQRKSSLCCREHITIPVLPWNVLKELRKEWKSDQTAFWLFSSQLTLAVSPWKKIRSFHPWSNQEVSHDFSACGGIRGKSNIFMCLLSSESPMVSMYHCDQCPKAQRYFGKHWCFFLICVKKNYINGNCHSRSRCSNCQGPHYFSICDPRGKSPKFKDPETQKCQSTVDKAREESYANISVLAPRHWSPPDSWSNRMYSPYTEEVVLYWWGQPEKSTATVKF